MAQNRWLGCLGPVVALFFVLAGCHPGRNLTRPALFGGYRDDPLVLLARARRAAEGAGYQVIGATPERGEFVLRARFIARGFAEPVDSLRVLVYEGNWVEVEPFGPSVQAASGCGILIPDRLHDELRQLTGELMRALGSPPFWPSIVERRTPSARVFVAGRLPGPPMAPSDSGERASLPRLDERHRHCAELEEGPPRR